ncbi:nucleotidyl transferase AbiEii/AbiGii toxin family protein [Patescibacteria group bacterium]|nr:nucleotidyl transferase AbiEii/AbiGii toxin family protein [Patescibacteria group bacterium]MBU1730502.1 nucleotidyl transferase AbiEii/AbiGii toxin family protein [Patescibacteria group bacterium]MBU1956763.1 nucleotidyl transferase AbiEii/AbiGii toxin family protein [Patescibacteria group bacterium]MBU2010456.1 nucleotidyl transferase AbiEii/AbiGii toxin family protein [Patescibacteria group bacterium]
MLHKEILTREQIDLLPLVGKFEKDFILVGGTAIALHIGHRQSIDFDLFSYEEFKNEKIKRKILRYGKIEETYVSEPHEYTFLINDVKMTFLTYPYEVKNVVLFDKIIQMPDLLSLAAMKAFALGRRGKWKDYVDLFFILKNFHSMKEISLRGLEIFGNEYNEKIFREALCYFDDINYSEKVQFISGFEIDDKIIKQELIDFSLS